MENIHATCITLKGRGILLIGKPGSGKSDLALRMILEKGAVLIADDRTDIRPGQNKPVASCPEKTAGLLEVRGVGIFRFPVMKQTEIDLIVELAASPAEIERLPEPETTMICGLPVKKIRLYPFELSAVHKLSLACGEKSEAC